MKASAVPFKNDFNQEIQPGDDVAFVTTSTSNVNVRKGKYIGLTGKYQNRVKVSFIGKNRLYLSPLTNEYVSWFSLWKACGGKGTSPLFSEFSRKHKDVDVVRHSVLVMNRIYKLS